MKRLVLLGVIGVMALGLWASTGCRDDIFIPPPPSLLGDYEGVFIYKEGTQLPAEQTITWRFTGNGYLMTLDGTEGERLFCDVAGFYTLENGVSMELTDSNRTAKTCDPTKGPAGQFALITVADTIFLRQQIGSITKEIILTPR